MSKKNNITSCIKFIKMHGLGNDFVIIDEQNLPYTTIPTEMIQKISDRKLGIGCDQLITYKKLGECLYKMHINNADGSSASLCGNAVRALTLLINEKENLANIQIKVGNKTLTCTYLSCDNIQVNVGKVSFDAEWIPKCRELSNLANIYKINEKDMICVDVGNPHLVILHKFINEKECSSFAMNVEKNKIFADGVNINFVNVEKDNLYMKTWERGLSGFSLACGSGACASFAAAKHLGFIEGIKSVAHFAIGKLTLFFNENQEIIMEGPAAKIFEGKYYYNNICKY